MMIQFLEKKKTIIILLVVIWLLWYLYPQSTDEFSITVKDFPPIKRYKNIFTKEECQQIIDKARPRLKRSPLGPNNTINTTRTSYQAWLKHDELPCIKRCAEFVARITGLPVENQEDWQVLRYKPGQKYKAHYDACSEESPTYIDCCKDARAKGWGKRVYTFFIYLNDVEEGGETHFPKLNISFEPQEGTAIFWHNLTADHSKAHPNSKHAGMPPVKGVKWAINVWIREQPRHRTPKPTTPTITRPQPHHQPHHQLQN